MPNLTDLVVKIKKKIKTSKDIEELESIRVKYLGKKGHISQQIMAIRDLPQEEKPAAGMLINQAKQEVQRALAERKITLKQLILTSLLENENIDVSLPGRRMENGGLHPISRTIARVEHFFGELGFAVATGPEIEDDYHNFAALNIPSHHLTRTDHDTFWLDTKRLLRTQTSSVQIRTMKAQKPPIRIIASGRVYRNDYDKTHTPMFHQIEGLMIDIDISFTHMKGMLHEFLRNFFEENLNIRFRPSYFPFTEPSAEVDVMDKNGRWLEVLGCGIVHPNVLRNVGISPEVYSGFAFGMGIERLTMQRYGVDDLRSFFENELRFLKQFK